MAEREITLSDFYSQIRNNSELDTGDKATILLGGCPDSEIACFVCKIQGDKIPKRVCDPFVPPNDIK